MSYPANPPLEPSFTNRNIAEVVECLIKSNLVFPVTLDRTQERPWEGINADFHEHLSTHGFDLKSRDGDDGKTFNLLSWDVMTKSKRQEKIKYQGGKQDWQSFNVEFVSKEAIQVNLQNETNDKAFLFLGISPSQMILLSSHPSFSPNRTQS
jgi:hypothetical protein